MGLVSGAYALGYRQRRRDLDRLHDEVRDEIAAALVEGIRSDRKIIPLPQKRRMTSEN